MSSKDLKEAAVKAAERKKLLKQPVPMRPDAPENIRLSKKEFIAKRRAEKEEDSKVEAYRQELRAKKETPTPEIPKEAEGGVQEKEKGKEAVKKGRPKRVE